ncbi:MAG: hypothetical protein ACJ741_06605, partial [Pyrinomonadaceae bacterium]
MPDEPESPYTPEECIAALTEAEKAQLDVYVTQRYPVPRVTLDDYVERVKDVKLDPWQVNLCGRIERAFWLSRAPLFEFETVDIGTGPAYVVAPSGFKID